MYATYIFCMPPTEFHRLLAAEHAAEAVRADLSRRECDRGRGVSWSGMEAAAFTPSTPQALRARARSRLAARRAFAASDEGAFLAALADCQAAAREAYAAAERGRAGAARGEPPAWRAQILADIRRQSRALSASLRRMGRAPSP